MVNSFLTSGPYDVDEKTGKRGFRISAANLDKLRLLKQIIEAKQIVNIIEAFHILGKMFKSPCPKNPYLVKEWSNEIMQKYKKLDYYLFYHQGEYVKLKKVDKNGNPVIKPTKLKYDEEYEIKNGDIIYKGKKYPKYGLVLPGDKLITLGFASHPVVIMWMNHVTSLKHYINCHIDEFLERGGKPGVIKMSYKIDIPIEDIEHPIWTIDTMFHLNHKAALITKEIIRKETPWYIKKRDFKIAYNYYIDHTPNYKNKTISSFAYYLWVFTQDIPNPRYLVKENSDGSVVCSIKSYSNSDNFVEA